MAKRKNDLNRYNYEREEEMEINRFRRVEKQRKWKFDSRNVDKYFSEEYDEDGNYEKGFSR